MFDIVDSSSLYVQNGASLALPLVAGYAKPQWNLDAYWIATGPGSTLSLPGLSGLGSVAHYHVGLWVQASQGAHVNLPGLKSIGTPSQDVEFQADGKGSQIDLSGLTTDTPAGGSISVTSHATLVAPHLTILDTVGVALDGTGTIAIDQWASLTDGSLTITGGSYTFPGLSVVDSSSLYVQNGAALSLPLVAGYAKPQSNLDAYWTATGPGSTLSLPGLSGLGSIANYHVGLWVQASQGCACESAAPAGHLGNKPGGGVSGR